MKIGIFGGSFDPPHIGHSEIARLSREKYELDELIFLPTGVPPHKRQGLIGGVHRLEMCRLVTEKYGFSLSDYEFKKNDFCYTADTMEHFSKLYAGSALYFIVGNDCIDYMDQWRQPERIFRVCTIISASRGGKSREKARKLEENFGARILFVDNRELAVSSTQVREQAKKGLPLGGLVEREVAAYIQNHNLYR